MDPDPMLNTAQEILIFKQYFYQTIFSAAL
jgi:hypothetical protein